MGDHFIVEAWALLAIATLVILLRLFYSYTRGGFWKMKMDDCSMILAGIFNIGETIAAHFVVVEYLGMANNNVLPEQRAALDPDSWEWHYTVNGSKAHIIGWVMYICLFWTLKSCWTLYYTRLT
ncbi:integral membrane protein pth11-like protein [Alternaria alternata]|nr:integral membrane protein pth11-like protein [Alternaria alternata]